MNFQIRKRKYWDIKEISDFYDFEVTPLLQKIPFENTLQSYRPKDIDSLFSDIAKNSQLKDHLKILDAGCGIGGPSLYFAKHFQVDIAAVTISKEQIRVFNQNILQASLKGNIQLFCMDYHLVDQQFEASSFDRIFFLESIGHSGRVKELLYAAKNVLKDDGLVYIKEPFIKISKNPIQQFKINKAIEKANEFYRYSHSTLSAFKKNAIASGFNIESIKSYTFKPDFSVPYLWDEINSLKYYKKKIEFAVTCEIILKKKV